MELEERIHENSLWLKSLINGYTARIRTEQSMLAYCKELQLYSKMTKELIRDIGINHPDIANSRIYYALWNQPRFAH